MLISIVNHSNGQIADDELQAVIRALNRQIQEDFAPYWACRPRFVSKAGA
ncbi:MAG TPA: hypothetical protein VFP10_14900 [Candidatus Eisenbacteria bacterium]|nr:hypothetical protein [Candidatus Eisenbacteria bacterium]